MKRDEKGRFLAGNPGGPGNPYAKRVANLRKALLKAVTEEDMVEVVHALTAKARKGDVAAAKVLLNRVFGPPISSEVIARIEELERQIMGGGK
jgi:hypothetical protein